MTLEERLDRLENKYFEEVKMIRQDNELHFQYDSGRCEGRISALKTIRAIMKEVQVEQATSGREARTDDAADFVN